MQHTLGGNAEANQIKELSFDGPAMLSFDMVYLVGATLPDALGGSLLLD